MKKLPDVREGAEIISSLMKWLNIDITESTERTPERVAKMYLEVFNGMYTDPPAITTFKADRGYICVGDITFASMCEHHLLPFVGKCSVVYFSDGVKVVGLSKIPRIVRYWSARPQLQERLTQQIATDIYNRINAQGVYVIMRATHSCMEMRGVKALGSVTTTSSLVGNIDKDEALQILASSKFFKD